MNQKKNDKVKQEMKPRDDGVEMENQFILRLPEEVARLLQEALQTGNLKDRMTIKMDNELRYGEVCFDHWLLHAKIVDLPTIIESLKSIDNKSFYKTADICQMMICKEEPDVIDSEKESPNKGKKKDPNKVDKKYLWPHGITPPCKNVRKRRFRKTLKKKNVEAPEIEKEVKRLLRVDNEAVRVDFEIINEDVKRSRDPNLKEFNEGDDDYNDDLLNENDKLMNDLSMNKDNVESDNDDEGVTRATHIGGVGEHDIFGEEVSSSSDDDDERRESTRDLEDNSRLSDDSRTSNNSVSISGSREKLQNEPTNFNKSMFEKSDSNEQKYDNSNSNQMSTSYYDDAKTSSFYAEMSNDAQQPQVNTVTVMSKLEDLREEYNDLKAEHEQKAQEISTIQNPTLRQRMQEIVDNLMRQITAKDLDIKEYESMLQEQM